MTTRVGVLGCGPWGRLIVRDLVSLGAATHVWSMNEPSRDAARQLGATSVHEHVDNLPACDGFVIATATSAHATSIAEVAARGVPMFVEKPLCADPDEADRLAELYGPRLFVMEKWRYHHGVLALADLVRSGTLGSVVGIETTRIGYADNHHDVDAAWILMPHDLSIALEIMGEVGPLRGATGMVDADGMVRSLSASYGTDRGTWLNVRISDRSPIERREVHVIGTTATAVLGGGYTDHIDVRRGTVVDRVPFTPNMPLLDELRTFVEYLSGGREPRTAARESARLVRLIADARSAIGGR